jgi:hypothetical protein
VLLLSFICQFGRTLRSIPISPKPVGFGSEGVGWGDVNRGESSEPLRAFSHRAKERGGSQIAAAVDPATTTTTNDRANSSSIRSRPANAHTND